MKSFLTHRSHLKRSSKGISLLMLALAVSLQVACSSSKSDNSTPSQPIPLSGVAYSDIQFQELPRAALNGSNVSAVLMNSLYGIDLVETLVLRYKGELSQSSEFQLFASSIDQYPFLFRPEFLSDDCTVSGSAKLFESGVESIINPKRSNEMVVALQNCTGGDRTVSGTIKAKDIISGKKIEAYDAIFDGLTFIDEHYKVKLQIDGAIRINHFDDLSDTENQIVWQSNLSIKNVNTGYTTYLHNVSRKGGARTNYRIDGTISISNIGSMVFDFNSEYFGATINGEKSSIKLVAENQSHPFQNPLCTIALDADGDGIADQEIEQLMYDTLSLSLHQNLTPQVMIQGSKSLLIGASSAIEASVQLSKDHFFETAWDFTPKNPNCSEKLVNMAPSIFEFSSNCDGTYVISFTADTGFKITTAEHFIRVYRPEPEVRFIDAPITISDQGTLSVRYEPTNPEYGPFTYSNVFGLPGTTLGNDSTLNWQLTETIYAPKPVIHANFGFNITNDLTTTQTFSLDVQLQNFSEPVFLSIPDSEELAYGRLTIDLEPHNPSGDIAFARNQYVYKFNKATRAIRKLEILLPGGGLKEGIFVVQSRRFTLTNANDDGIKDLVYIYRNEIDLSTSDKRLFAYDLFNESVISDFSIVTNTYRGSGEIDISPPQKVDLDKDGTASYVFYLPYHWGDLRSDEFAPGIYEIDPVTGKSTRIYSQESFESLHIRDTDKDGHYEIYLTKNRSGIEVIKLIKQGGSWQKVKEYRSEYQGGSAMLLVAFQDTDGDQTEEITLADYGTSSCSSSQSQGTYGTLALVLDNELSPLNIERLNYRIVDGAPSLSTKSNEVYGRVLDCGTNDSYFAYVNLTAGRVLWTVPIAGEKEHYGLAMAYDAATEYTDADGDTHLFMAVLSGISILNKN